TMGTHNDEARSSRSKCSRQYETVEEAMLPRVHHLFLLWEGCTQATKSRYNTRLAQLLPRLIYELFHEFYSTYEFDEVCADDELRTKKIIKFRLCGLMSTSMLENISLSRSHASTIRKPVLRVLHKMITYGLCQKTTRWMKRKGAGSQKESMICCGQFITKIAKRKNLLSEEVLNSLSASIYYRVLDTTTLRELIDSEDRLIPEVYSDMCTKSYYCNTPESIDT
ncbi:hypothetical protein Tco_0898624, partial [Tanacetum coccineum]